MTLRSFARDVERTVFGVVTLEQQLVEWTRTGVEHYLPEEDRIRIAQEMIRQMRWSRHAHRWANPESMEWEHPADPTEEPTLAPPDWNP